VHPFRLVLAVGFAGAALVVPAPPDPWDFRLEIPYRDADDPFRDAALRARMERLAPLVSEVVGGPIDLSGIRIRAVDPDMEAERALLEAYPRITDLASEVHAANRMPLVRIGLRMLHRSRLGWYARDAKTIDINAWAFEASEPGHPDGLLDVVVAHELTHVWQDQRFGVFREERKAATSEAELAASAVLEGSAEFVAREVARRTGHLDAFGRLEARRAKEDEHTRSPILWPYAEGLRFVDVVRSGPGPVATWERLFAEPPRTVWEVEHPSAWLRSDSPQGPDLDGWAERLAWCLGERPHEFKFQTTWDVDPLFQADLDARLGAARLASTSGAWAECRGGARLDLDLPGGPLAGERLSVRAWRFSSPHVAVEARRTLEDAADRIGPAAWAAPPGAASALPPFLAALVEQRGWGGEVEGVVRVRSSVKGATVRTALRWITGWPPGESSWAVHVHGTVLYEVMYEATGAGPAVFDVTDTIDRAWDEAEAIDAARAGSPAGGGPWADLATLRTGTESSASLERMPDDVAVAPLRDAWLSRRLLQPGAESDVLEWLGGTRDPAPWIAALAPPGDGTANRGGILEFALRHPDDDVRRYALGAVAGYRVYPSPWSGAVPGLIEEATRDEDPSVRVAAVRAAEALHEEDVLGPEQVDRLLADGSPAMRAALAASKDVLGDRRAEILEALRRDPHAGVRAVVERKLKKEEADPFDGWLGFGSRESEASALLRVRRDLLEGKVDERWWALSRLGLLEDARASFLPELVRALADPALREAALPVLQGGGLDLAPARTSLVAMLEHPVWRPDVLRVLAANDLALPLELVQRVRAWSAADEPRLRCAAALMLLRITPDEDAPLALLESSWDDVPSSWHPGIVAAATARRPGAEAALRLLSRALTSPFREVRTAGIEAATAGELDEGRAGVLLGGIPDVGPTAAGERWHAWMDRMSSLHDQAATRAADLLAEYLNRWRDADGLPVIDGEALRYVTLPDVDESAAAVEAIDRCLVREGTSILQLSLVLLRDQVDAEKHPWAPALETAVARHASLEPLPPGFPPYERHQFVDVLAKRARVPVEDLVRVLERAAALPWDELNADYGGLVKAHRVHAGALVELVPGFLARGTRSSAEVALQILEASGPAAASLLPRLEVLASDAMPSWRRRLEECGRTIAGLDAAPEDDPPTRKHRRASRPRAGSESSLVPFVALGAAGLLLLVLVVVNLRIGGRRPAARA
jgi:hypothetical protein